MKKIGIIGVGLLGGAIGLCIKEKYPHILVIGVGRNENNLKNALKLNAIDNYIANYDHGLEDCDIIIIATPISTITKIFFNILPQLKPQAIVTDVGSTKNLICSEIAKNDQAKQFFIGSHPMAGSEKNGIEASTPDLYLNAIVVVIENSYTNKKKLNTLISFWKALGANIILMSAEQHDRIVAQTSHLPHVLASSLAYFLSNNLSENEKKIKLFGKGLLDTTRIAEGDPNIWLDIIISNKNNILESINVFKNALNYFENIIQLDNKKEITEYLNQGRQYRKQITI